MMVSHSVLYHRAPSHSGQHTSTAPCCGHTEPLQRVLRVNTSEETAADRETHLYIHHQVHDIIKGYTHIAGMETLMVVVVLGSVVWSFDQTTSILVNTSFLNDTMAGLPPPPQ